MLEAVAPVSYSDLMTDEKPRIAALDIGDARIGLALTDPLGLFAQPLCTIEGVGKRSLVRLLDLFAAHGVSEIAVGLPFELSGMEGSQAARVREIVQRLGDLATKRALQLKFEFIDERLTTVEAKHRTAGSKLKNREQRALLDRVAAAIILESYLAQRGQKS
jgi:putative holliday junction resolvase